MSLAQAIAAETNDRFLKAKHAAISFAVMPSVIDGNAEQIDAMLVAGEFASQDINQIARISADGIKQYNFPAEQGADIGQNVSFERYFQQVKDSGEHLFSDVRLYPQKDNPVIISAVPIFQDELFDGVVTINFELDQLDERLAEINSQRTLNNQVDIAIIDVNQRVVASSFDGKLLEPIEGGLPLVDGAWPKNTTSFVSTDLDGVEWLYTYANVQNAGWIVVVKHQTELAFASLKNFRNGLILALIVFGIGAILFWVFLSRKVIGPLVWLTRYGESIDQRIAGLDATSVSISTLGERQDQVGRLTHTLMQAESSVRRRLAELTTLNKTSTAVLSSLDTEEVIDTILDEIQRLLQVSQCAILIENGARTGLKIQASRGLPVHFSSYLEETDREVLPASWAIRDNEPFQVSDIFVEPYKRLWPLAQKGNYRSLLAIPLNTLHGEPAALVIYRPDVHHFTPEEIDLATNFANHAAIALEHALLFRMTDIEMQKQVRFLSALNRVGHTVSQSLVMDEILGNVIDTVFDITESDACWIFLRRAGDPFLRLRAQRGVPTHILNNLKDKPLDDSGSVAEFVVDQDQSVRLNLVSPPAKRWGNDPFVSDNDGSRWLVAVPLRAKNATIGVLGMMTHREEIYSEKEVGLLESIGDQIAIAVVNARLYNRSREMAMLEERNRVAREIHDTIIQSLTGILVHLQGIKRLKEKRPDQVEVSLDDALSLAHDSLREARRSVLNLRPLALETLTLDQAIAQHLDTVAQKGEIQSRFKIEGYPSALKNDVEQHLYRISQEALNNIIRHAHATEVEVRLAYDIGSVSLTIIDNGVGLKREVAQFPYDRSARRQDDQGGFGLIGIKERVRLVGGQITIQPAPLQGTKITVVIPK